MSCMEFSQFREQFNVVLREWLHKKITTQKQLILDDELFLYLEHIENLVMGGGKRIRPYLAYLIHIASGGKDTPDIWKLGIAFELFHTYGLMHDDIVDRGDNRHGVPTMHKYIAERMRSRGAIGDIDHIAEGQAIFIGDLIISWTHQLWEEVEFSFEQKKHARDLFHTMIDEVLIGQIIDIDFMGRQQATMQLIEQKMALKTASYTFVRPMQIGAALAGANGDVSAFCHTFGRALGVAFQIQDDYFDLTASSAELQKTVLSDLRDRQQTVFTQYIFDYGTDEQKEALSKLLGATLTETDHEQVRALFTSSGSIAFGLDSMNKQFDGAYRALDYAPLPEPCVSALRELIVYIRHRTV